MRQHRFWLVLIAIAVALRSRGGVHVPTSARWPTVVGKVIYYTVDPDVPMSAQKAIDAAAARWSYQARGIIEVRRADVTPMKPRPYIRFRVASAAESFLASGPENARSLGEGLVAPKGANEIIIGDHVRIHTVLHALGHRLGLAHEFRHCQRGQYLKAPPSPQYWLVDEGTLACPPWSKYVSMPEYDLESIMHLNPRQSTVAPYELTPQGKEEIESRFMTIEGLFNPPQLSYGDLMTLRDLYCDTPNACPDAAFKPLEPFVFQRGDYAIFLISGNRNMSAPLGYAGKGSLYATHVPGMTPATPLRFDPVVEGVHIERRSTKGCGPSPVNSPTTAADPCDEYNDFGTDKHVPPGIYFLHHHRIDAKAQPVAPRPRLGISDAKCAAAHDDRCEVIAITWNGQPFERKFVQFHAAFNNMGRMSPDISQGCITSTWNNFSRLFPPSFLDPATSPMYGADGFKGDGNILVFVTDSRDAAKQDKQIALFDGWRLSLSPAAFQTGSTVLDDLRRQWFEAAR